jgi:dTDP-glucose 4,6-dehydratase/UDP-glucose 4-epimerase
VRVLVTGGAGFIGAALTRRLCAGGHDVTVLDDTSRGKWDRLNGVGCVPFGGDVRDLDDVITAMHGCDTVVHLAYRNGTQSFYEEPRLVLDVAVRGMLNILTACEATGCGDLLLVSSSEAYQVATTVPTPETVALSVPDVLNPRYSYGGGKIACEIMALAWQRTGVLDRAAIARPHNIYAGDMGREHVIPEFCLRMNRLVREHPEGIIPFPIQGSGEETRSFCYVDDCIGQLALLLDRAPAGPSVWHVGTEDERTIAATAYAVAACYGREIKVLPGTLPKGSPPRRLPDTSKIQALGWDASKSVPFEDGLVRTVTWYQRNG